MKKNIDLINSYKIFEEESKIITEGKNKGDSKFKFNTFIDTVNILKNRIIALLTECDTVIKDEDLGGSDIAKEYKKKFLDYLIRASSLLGNANIELKKNKSTSDEKIISTFNESYKALLNDLTGANEKYEKAKNLAIEEKQKTLRYKDIATNINNGITAFNEANIIRAKYIKSSGTPKIVDKSVSTTTKSTIKIETPIKRWEKGKPSNETVKKVQQLIYDKFKNNKVVSATALFQSFYNKGKGIDGYNGRTTSSLIILLKKGFGMKDESSDITQDFIDSLNSLSESSISLNKLPLFEKFLKDKGVYEEFNADKFTKAYTEYTEKDKNSKHAVTKIPSAKIETKNNALDIIIKDNPKRDKKTLSNGLKSDFLLAWATGISNKSTTFEYKDKTYSTITARSVSKTEEKELDKKSYDTASKEITSVRKSEIEKIAVSILINFMGSHENEEDISLLIGSLNNIDELDYLKTLWNNMKITNSFLKRNPSDRAYEKESITFKKMGYSDIVKYNSDENKKDILSLKNTVGKYFNEKQVSQLNGVIPRGATKFYRKERKTH